MTQIGKLTVTRPGDRELAMTRVFAAPRAVVFDHWTKPALLRTWLSGAPGWEMTLCEIDLRVGGAYRYVWRKPDGSEMGMGGVHLELDAPERLVCTQKFDVDWTGGETVGTLHLVEGNGGTTLVNTIRYPSPLVRNGVVASGVLLGVEAGNVRLDALLAALPKAS